MKSIFFQFILLLCFAFHTQAQPMPIVIQGTVVYTDGAVASNIGVYAVIADSTVSGSANALTGPSGQYTMTLQSLNGLVNNVIVGVEDPCGEALPIVASTNPAGAPIIADFIICREDTTIIIIDTVCAAYFFAEQAPNTINTFNFTSFLYNVDPNTNVQYNWTFGDGMISNEANPTHTYTDEGIYSVTLSITAADCSSYYTADVFVFDFPPPADCYGYFTSQQSQSNPFTFTFTPEIYDNQTGTTIAPTSATWDFGDNATSTDITPTHTYAQEGIYNVLMHALTADSCEVHACDIVFAYENGPPVDTFLYGCQAMYWLMYDPNGGNPGGGTPTNTVSFLDGSLGVVQSWAWNFGDGTTSTEQNPIHTYAQAGIYTVSLSIVTLDGCESTASFEIYVGQTTPWVPEYDCQAMFIPMPCGGGNNPGDTSGVFIEGCVQFIDLSTSFYGPIQSWLWDFGDGNISTEQFPTHTYATPGEYIITLTINGDSCASTFSYPILSTEPWNFNMSSGFRNQGGTILSTDDTEGKWLNINAFPNPTAGDIHLQFTAENAEQVRINVLDINGRIVAQNHLAAQTGSNQIMLPAANLPSGLYLVEMATARASHTIKVVKQ